MKIETDDEVYRVDAVWLGPKDFGFPWRARYVAYGLSLPIFVLVVAGERLIGVGVGLWSTVWAVLITIGLVRFIGTKIDYERPVTAVWRQVVNELRTPRHLESVQPRPSQPRPVRVSPERPLPVPRPTRRERRKMRSTASREGIIRRIVAAVTSRKQERRNDEGGTTRDGR